MLRCKPASALRLALLSSGDLIGSGEAQERGIVGETPNLAARLQGVAAPNAVVIAESTRRLIGSLFELQDSICCFGAGQRQRPAKAKWCSCLARLALANRG
jgi:class 3 adenylate cyclase